MIEKNLNGFEVIFLLNLIPALRVKDVTIFDLLDQEFHYGEFIFFSRLANHLGKIVALSKKDAQDVGILSEIMYLSSKIHCSLVEQPETEQQLRAALQMPVLLGDLLYSRLIVHMTETGKTACLPVYLDYLRQFNQQRIDDLVQQKQTLHQEFYLVLLAQKTAAAIALLVGATATVQENLKIAAENYLREQWPLLYGEQITSLEALETRIQAELL